MQVWYNATEKGAFGILTNKVELHQSGQEANAQLFIAATREISLTVSRLCTVVALLILLIFNIFTLVWLWKSKNQKMHLSSQSLHRFTMAHLFQYLSYATTKQVLQDCWCGWDSKTEIEL